MEDVKRADDDAKWELIRRLRYGALLKLFRHRWGHVVPNDDAGRDDLWLRCRMSHWPLPNPKRKCGMSSRRGHPGCQQKRARPMSRMFGAWTFMSALQPQW